ncbi:MAG: tRNA pseudouridine(55) synthase TruB [Desulfobacteraceae bacterium]|nr:tRNA pseudouridine(55) synthase TruB [Desulfobacteraceae bacterium]
MMENNGIILLNKPEDLSSNTAVNIVKKIFSSKKAGHTGTLDPFAEGLLPVCINKGTKIVRYLMDKDKEYTGTIRLGSETDTLDKTGKITDTGKIPELTPELIENAMKKFRGTISQVPPAYSALKHNGIPLYKYARNGEIIEKKPRHINIYKLETIFFDHDILKIKVKCSKGTYIRSLASDLARELGTFGHLEELTRTKSGSFDLENAFTLEALRKKQENNQLEDCIINIEDATSFLKTIQIDTKTEQAVSNGKKINLNDISSNFTIEEDTPFRLLTKNNKIKAFVRMENNCDFLKYDAVFN